MADDVGLVDAHGVEEARQVMAQRVDPVAAGGRGRAAMPAQVERDHPPIAQMRRRAATSERLLSV